MLVLCTIPIAEVLFCFAAFMGRLKNILVCTIAKNFDREKILDQTAASLEVPSSSSPDG